MPWLSTARGQTLVLLVMSMLVLVLMAMMTLSIASRVRDRIELQTLADSAAYSNAVATSRSFNNASLLNRAMVSQWSAMCGIATLHAWGSSQNAYFYAMAGTAIELNDPNPQCTWGGFIQGYNSPELGNCQDGNGWWACRCRWNTDPSPVNPPLPQDCDGRRRQLLDSEYAQLIGAGDQAWGRGYAALDSQVIQQVRDLWQSMDDLGRVETATHQKLQNALQAQTYAQNLFTLSGVRESVTVLNGPGAGNVALREVKDASPINPAPASPPAPKAHLRAMEQALMGSRGDTFYSQQYHPPFAFEDWMTRNGRGNGVQYNLGNGAWIRYSWPSFTRNTSHPGGYCQDKICPYAQSLRSQPPTSWPNHRNNNPFDNNQMDELYDGFGSTVYDVWGNSINDPGPGIPNPGNRTPWRGPALAANWGGLYGGTWAGALQVEFHDVNVAPNGQGCGGSIRVNVGEAQSFVWYTVPNGPETPRHYTTGHHPNLDEDVGHHPGELGSNAHIAGNANTQGSFLPFSIGFVFPSLGDDGSNGAWGQPKTPALLKRDQRHKDPWDMLTGMRFQQSSSGTELDLQKGYKGPVALGNAISYYHRTSTTAGAGAWAEAPSFLNPFWRATLVPIDIDARAPGTAIGQDNTPSYTQGATDDVKLMLGSPMLGGPGSPEYLAYQALTAAGYKGGQ
jgi:hypothetical protein